jgi:hypothetical protein
LNFVFLPECFFLLVARLPFAVIARESGRSSTR